MHPHKIITSNLRNVGNLHQPHISKWLQSSRDKVHVLGSEMSSVVVFWDEGVDLWSSWEILKLSVTPNTQLTRTNTLWNVIRALDTQTYLNHVGIGYEVPDVNAEVQRLTDLIKEKSRYHLYEDEAWRDEGMRWLFIWDKDTDAPMCEVVLPEWELRMRPHMQFDVDTELPPKKIEEKMGKAFWDNMLDWHLDIPWEWVVLSMGTYENRQIDLRVGIGSNLRSKEAQRENMIKIS